MVQEDFLNDGKGTDQYGGHMWKLSPCNVARVPGETNIYLYLIVVKIFKAICDLLLLYWTMQVSGTSKIVAVKQLGRPIIIIERSIF